MPSELETRAEQGAPTQTLLHASSPEAERRPGPGIVSFRLEGVPLVLRELAQWVAWSLRPPKKAGDKPGKIPINPHTGRNASTTNPRTWDTFEQATRCMNDRALPGVGFVFTKGFVGIDLDKCRDSVGGTIEPWARAIVDRLATYTEISPTGTGLHLIVKGTLPGGGMRRGQIEMYDRGRFFTITGVSLEGTPAEIGERQDQIDALHRETFSTRAAEVVAAGARRSSSSTITPNRQRSKTGRDDVGAQAPTALTDEEVLERAERAKNGLKFAGLFGGDIHAHPSHSEADAALCCMLAFWTRKDADQMDRLFRRSQLMRPKWDERHGERTYGQATIANAINATNSTYGDGVRAGPDDDGRAQIVVTPGGLHETVRQAEDVLLAQPSPTVFQRDRTLCRIVRLPNPSASDGIKHQAGNLLICPVDEDFLVHHLTKLCTWLRPTGRGPKPMNAPHSIARTLMELPGEWRLPQLAGVIQAPTIRPDGSILTTPGYDPATKLYFDAGGIDFGTVNARPTREDALVARDVLVELLKGFPFVDECDRSAALAAILTALVRLVLPTSPMFVFRAPTRGTGKSLLADVVSLIATGRSCAVVTQGRDETEDQKRVLAILMEGDQVACIDNIERPLGGADLCTILTQEFYQGRLLGASKMIKVSTRTLWLATGNNMIVEGDLTSRVVVCDLDAKTEAPERREFDVVLRDHVRERRVEIVRACLTILAAHRAAGSPKKGLSTLGRFEAWSDTVRAAVIWLDCADPLGGVVRLEESDPVLSRLRNLLTQVWAAFRDQPFTLKNLIGTSRADEAVLSDAVLDIASGPGFTVDRKQLGTFISKNANRIVNGMRIVRAGTTHGAARWRVEHVRGGQGGQSSPFAEGSAGGCDHEDGGGSEREGEGLTSVPPVPPDAADTPKTPDQRGEVGCDASN